jgi:hypothetical protein
MKNAKAYDLINEARDFACLLNDAMEVLLRDQYEHSARGATLLFLLIEQKLKEALEILDDKKTS